MNKLRDHHDIDSNPVGLPDKVVQELIPELDALVASQFVIFHQYQKHHWLVEGPQFRDLHLFLAENYTAVHNEVDALAERITLLGGIPTSNPVNQSKISHITHESEGVFPIRECLVADMGAEGIIARNIRRVIAIANGHGDFGTKAVLEPILLAVENRAHHLEHFLGKDTLLPLA